MRPVRIGCSGWSYDDWRGAFYPDDVPRKRWLETYAETFDTVEVNNTFYRLPKQSAVAGWAEQTPPDFLFACKASRYLTHIKRLQSVAEGAARFLAVLEPLRDAGKLGPILWQLPGELPPRRRASRGGASRRSRTGATPSSSAIPPGSTKPSTDSSPRQARRWSSATTPGVRFIERRSSASWTYIRFHRGTAGAPATTPTPS